MASTYKMVAYGSQGDAVRQLQSELNKHGYQLDEDGIFGSKTKAAVQDYQKKNSLRLDGIAGDETWGSLMAAPAAEAETGEETEAAPVARPSAKTAQALAKLERGYTPSEDVTAAQAYRENFKMLADTGVTVLAGTDMVLHGAPIMPVGRELAYMVEYGMSPVQAIATATGNAAAMLDLGRETGMLAAGLCGDILVVRGDASQDITALQSPVQVYRAGKAML